MNENSLARTKYLGIVRKAAAAPDKVLAIGDTPHLAACESGRTGRAGIGQAGSHVVQAEGASAAVGFLAKA